MLHLLIENIFPVQNRHSMWFDSFPCFFVVKEDQIVLKTRSLFKYAIKCQNPVVNDAFVLVLSQSNLTVSTFERFCEAHKILMTF